MDCGPPHLWGPILLAVVINRIRYLATTSSPRRTYSPLLYRPFPRIAALLSRQEFISTLRPTRPPLVARLARLRQTTCQHFSFRTGQILADMLKARAL